MLNVFKFTAYVWKKAKNTNKDLKWTSKGPQINLYGVPMIKPPLCTYMIELKHFATVPI